MAAFTWLLPVVDGVGRSRCWPWQFRFATLESIKTKDQRGRRFSRRCEFGGSRGRLRSWFAGWGWVECLTGPPGSRDAVLHLVGDAQLLFQNIVAKRIRSAMGASWKSWLLAGSLWSCPSAQSSPDSDGVLGRVIGISVSKSARVARWDLIRFVLSTCLFSGDTRELERNYRVARILAFSFAAMWF